MIFLQTYHNQNPRVCLQDPVRPRACWSSVVTTEICCVGSVWFVWSFKYIQIYCNLRGPKGTQCYLPGQPSIFAWEPTSTMFFPYRSYRLKIVMSSGDRGNPIIRSTSRIEFALSMGVFALKSSSLALMKSTTFSNSPQWGTISGAVLSGDANLQELHQEGCFQGQISCVVCSVIQIMHLIKKWWLYTQAKPSWYASPWVCAGGHWGRLNWVLEPIHLPVWKRLYIDQLLHKCFTPIL